MTALDPCLVVGADSLIGHALLQRWRSRSHTVWSTTRRPGPPVAGTLALDLAADSVAQWSPPASFRAAVLCASITDQDTCRRHPAATRHINVTQTTALARRLIELGSFVIFLSTSLVFDGSHELAPPDEPVSPRTEYGRQKADVETALLQHEGRVAVVRLTKVFHSALPLLRSWSSLLSRAQVIQPYSNYFCSPISLASAVAAIAAIAEQKLPGIWHVSPLDQISYAEIGMMMSRQISPATTLVHPTACPGGVLEHLPPFTSLDASPTRQRLGITLPNSRDVVAAAFLPAKTP